MASRRPDPSSGISRGAAAEGRAFGSPRTAEIFGPCLTMMRFADEAEAIALANDTEYGLTSYLQARVDAARALALRSSESVLRWSAWGARLTVRSSKLILLSFASALV